MANRKISELSSLATPVVDDLLPIVDISEGLNANKNKKITYGEFFRSVADGTETAPAVAFDASATTGLYRSAANELSIATNGGQAIKIEANNKTTIFGDLVVTGSQTTVSSTTITVADKNLELATGNSSDAGCDGGGLTLKGATDKTWNWVDSTDAWTSNQNLDLTSTKSYRIANALVLDATTLGPAVVNSSLTSVGTLGTLSVTGQIAAGSLDISGNVDVDGTMEADAYTVDGTSLDEFIADTVGAMVSSNTETNITVTYDDSDNTLDFVIGTLNQDTTGNAATATALETARTIGGVSFNGTANISLPGVNTTGNQNTTGSAATLTTARTIGGVSFDGSANISLPGVNAAGNQNTSGTAAGLSGTPNITVADVVAASLDISGNADIDGTLEADAYTVNGTALNEFIADTVGAMVSSNTETNIAVTYQDSDNTLDFVIGTLNQDTTGNAATATALQTARTIGGVSFDGTANITLPGVNSVGNQNTTGSAATLTTARTIGGVSFDGSANITLPGVNSVGNQNTTGSAATLTTARTIGGVSFDGSANITLPGVNSAGNQNTSGTSAGLTGTPNITVADVVAASLDISGNVDIDGTLETDALTINGTSLAETISDTVGAMVTSNTETGISVTYDDADNTLDFVVGTLNQNTTGNAATATALQTARTIGGTSFDGTANITPANATNAVNLSGTIASGVTGTTQATSDNSTKIATTAYVTTAVANLIDSAPGALDTLNELAAAIGDDANFSTTITNSIATKLPLAGGTMTGAINLGSNNITNGGTITGTFVGNITGNVTGNTSGSSGSCTGNAATATALATARTIGGVSFDGTSNISLPGVNAVGNQNTTGSAATLTTARTIGGVSFNGSANINLPGVNAAGNQSTSGNAATATALATARAINGVNFDGTAAITVTAAAGTLTGNTLASGVTASSLTSVGTLTGLTVSGDISMTGTGAIDIPSGTTAQRPGSPTTGHFRYNTTDAQFEGFTSTGWGAIAGGGGAANFTYLALRNAANNGSAVFDGSQSEFTLVSSGTTTAISPSAANVLLTSLGGVIQKPNTGTSASGITGFCIDGSTIKFGANLTVAPDFIIHQVGAGVGTPSDNTVDLAHLAHKTQGDILYYGSGGAPGLMGAGTSGKFLRTNGSGADPSWETIDLTNLSASHLTSGTVPDARFPSTLPAASGANLTALNGSNISSGTIAAARVATLNQNTTGSAATLTTARTIAGVSFDGSANISLNNNAITNGAGYVTSSIINSLNASNLSSGTVAAARLDTATTQTAGNNSTKIATTAFVSTAVTNLIGGAPGALDTLNELAAAINDDSSFASTVTTSLGTKLNTSGGTLTGVLSLTSSSQYPININNSNDGKIVLQGSSHPFIRFREGSTDRAFIQWQSDNNCLEIRNQEDDSGIRIKDNLIFTNNGWSNTYKIWNESNDGAGSGLDADLLDGKHDTSFLRSDAGGGAASYNATSDITFSGGSGAVSVAANSDIRLSNGTWSGDFGAKIQHHDNTLFLQGGSSGVKLRNANGSKNLIMNGDGHFFPAQANAYDLGTSSNRWKDIYTSSVFLTDTNTSILEGSGNSLKVVTNSGHMEIGPQNSSWCHINTDRGSFYMNKHVSVDGNHAPYGNNQHSSGTTGDRWSNVYSQGLNVTRSSGNLSAIIQADNGLGTIELAGSTGAFIDLKSPTSDDYDLRIGTSGSGGYLTVPSGHIECSASFIPNANNSRDLGSSSLRWRDLYIMDLQLSNKGGANEVDGTWGDWTLQEGEEDIFMLNNRTGKRYKMALQEVT